jgi:arylsulfatase A-like enzyme
MKFLLCLLLTVCHVSSSFAKEKSKPNLVFILVDDLRWNALGCYGDKVVQTPHIDRLARQGVLFQNAFVTTSICSVSRATVLTGQWMRRHGIVDFKTGLTPEAWKNTYPARLREAGYRTGFVGKYGVGDQIATDAKAADFDFWRGESGQAGKVFIEPNDPSRTHKTVKMGNDALEFLKGSETAKPFCLSISFNAVHSRDGQSREFEPDPRDEPLYADRTIPLTKLASEEAFARLPEFVQKSEGRTRWLKRFSTPELIQSNLRDYYRLITGVDREVGRIMETLESKGLAQNTVVIFTADNGYTFAERGMADKWFPWEEDIRVSSIIYDPRLPAEKRGKQVPAMVLNVDYAPTMLDLAGVAIPSVMQGRSLKPLLLGETPANWRKEFFYEHHSVARIIPPSEAVRTERWKYIRWIKSEPLVEELYDLQTDPLEERNLIADKACAEELQKLKTRWESYSSELR